MDASTSCDKLQADGRPVEYLIFPDAEHGIITFEQKDDGERRYTGYEPDYSRGRSSGCASTAAPETVVRLQSGTRNTLGCAGHDDRSRTLMKRTCPTRRRSQIFSRND